MSWKTEKCLAHASLSSYYLSSRDLGRTQEAAAGGSASTRINKIIYPCYNQLSKFCFQVGDILVKLIHVYFKVETWAISHGCVRKICTALRTLMFQEATPGPAYFILGYPSKHVIPFICALKHWDVSSSYFLTASWSGL